MKIAAQIVLVMALGAGAVSLLATRAPELPGKTNDKNSTTRLHNGWKISPVGKLSERTGDMITGCALSPDGKLLAISNSGAQAHFIRLMDTSTGKFVAELNPTLTQNGLAWSPDGKTLYASGGITPDLHVFTRQANGEYTDNAISLDNLERSNASLSGVAVSPDGKTVYVANLKTDAVFAVDIATRKVARSTAFDIGARPSTLRVAGNGAIFVTLWAKESVAEIDPATMAIKRVIKSGAHPNDLRFSTDGSRLFVSCGNSDAVFVHDAATGAISERIRTTMTPNAPAGATPSALALSPDGKTLFVANSDNNNVAVIDVATPGRSKVRGFVPTAQYPTVVAVSNDGQKLFIGSGKGAGFGPNGQPEDGKIDPVAPRGYPYITQLMAGYVQTVDMPTLNARLPEYSKLAQANSPYVGDSLRQAPAKAPKSGTNPIPSRVGEASPIKHVLYIIKENRTYDQVFGDMTDKSGKRIGNGEPKLCLFGENVTPNHHELARQFVLLDNTYCDGEVSVDGHQWSKGGYVTDFMQRTWPAQYGGKGRPPLTPDLSENPGGYIWENCKKAGLSYKTYYYHTTDNRSDAWADARAGRVRDYQAVDIFLKEFDEFEKTKTLPRFMVMALSEDHTSGTSPGAFTPSAQVGSNDYGLGKIVERLSKSPYWKETAIFVIEDDAQNGPDHVDAHRTVALVISPYTRRAAVDSTMYTTNSLLRTMELILGLGPMSQFDAAATPMYNAFTNKADLTPYTAVSPKVALDAKNPARAVAAARMQKIDFSEPDQLTREDEDALNRALWHSIKGEKTPYPGVTRSAFSAGR